MKEMRVTGLWIFPIKSCRGISLNEMQITKTGPAFDRQFMLVDKNNQFITLRTESRLSQIQPSIQDQTMTLRFGSQSIDISLNKKSTRVESVTVWKDTFLAGIESDDVNSAFSEFLGYPVKLARYQQESFRDIQSAATDVVKETMFADGRPILLVNESSLTDLNKKLSVPSDIVRFRGNIIISGLDAFKEDDFKTWTINGVGFTNPKRCARCPIVTQEIKTGQVVSKETLAKLATYRREGTKILFGVNLTPSSLGKIAIGDEVVGHQDM